MKIFSQPSLTFTCQLHDEGEVCCPPNLYLVVCGRGNEVGRVRRKFTAEAVFLVGEYLVLWVELRRLFGTSTWESPHIAVTLEIFSALQKPYRLGLFHLVIDGSHVQSLRVNWDTLYWDVGLGYQLFWLICLKVPHVNNPGLVANHEFLAITH